MRSVRDFTVSEETVMTEIMLRKDKFNKRDISRKLAVPFDRVEKVFSAMKGDGYVFEKISISFWRIKSEPGDKEESEV